MDKRSVSHAEKKAPSLGDSDPTYSLNHLWSIIGVIYSSSSWRPSLETEPLMTISSIGLCLRLNTVYNRGKTYRWKLSRSQSRSQPRLSFGIALGQCLLPTRGGLLWVLLLLVSSTMGCGSLANGRGWGQDAFTRPRSRTIAQAAKRAFFNIQTLAPAAGALIFAAADVDERVSDWAREETPIFGSGDRADQASDILRDALLAETLVSALLTPSGPAPKQWIYAKVKGVGTELLAVGATVGLTEGLKTVTGRTRPDQGDDRSFPSGHASSAFAAATLTNRHLDILRLPTVPKRSLQVMNVMLASGVAWARVEGGRHFPSDVLAGAALGHFISSFIHDVVLGLPDTVRIGAELLPTQKSGMVRISFGF